MHRTLWTVVLACLTSTGFAQDIQRTTRQFTLWPKVRDASPVSLKTLYVSTDGGATWREASEAGVIVEWTSKDAKPGARVTVPADGRWSFYFVIGDAVTNTNAAPAGGAKPQVSVAVKSDPNAKVEPVKPAIETKPSVAPTKPAPVSADGVVISPKGGETWSSGTCGLIKWMAPEGAGRPRSVALYYRTGPDAPWELITVGLETAGFYLWGVPGVSSERAQVRVTIQNDDGKERVLGDSKVFTIKAMLEPDHAGARRRYDAARVHAARGDMGLAAGELDEALRLWPEYPDALNDLGAAYFQLGEHGKALELFLRASRVQQADPRPLYNVACALLSMGLERDALAKLKAATAVARELDERLSSAMAEKFLMVAGAHQRRGDAAGTHQACVWGLELPKASPIIRARLQELLRAAAEHLPDLP